LETGKGGAPAMDLSYQEAIMNREEARRKLVESYISTGSISNTARLWGTSRNVVRKWVRRWEEEGLSGLADHSRRSHHFPHQVAPLIEEKVVKARSKTGYGRKRLAWYLWREEHIEISPYTIRHILHRNNLTTLKEEEEGVLPGTLVMGGRPTICFGSGGCKRRAGQRHSGYQVVGSHKKEQVTPLPMDVP